MNKRNAFIAATQAGLAREFAWIKNNGETNTRMSADQRSRRKARNRLTKHSRKANRG